MYTTIETLWEKTKNKSYIAKTTRRDWKTIAKTVKDIESGKKYPVKKAHPRILDPYKEKVIEWLEQGLNRRRIFEELVAQGVSIKYTAVKDYVALIKKREKIFIRVHTESGEEAQVDFGYVGLTLDNNGKKRKTWVFNMRLSFSRLDYYEKVYNQKVETFIQCHINAFKYFGGTPKYVKIDNLKAAILEANFVEHNYYSVPFEYVGKDVEIELTDNLLRVSYRHKEVALHPKLSGNGNWSTTPSHYPKYKLYSETEFQEKYQIKMKETGDYAEQLFFLILKNRPHDWTRPVQGILSLPKSYSKDIVDLACKRAVAYDIHTYQTVKNICKNRSYLLPVEFDFEGENMPCNF